MRMNSLRGALERRLHDWPGALPTTWRDGLDGVAPDFDAVPADAALDETARIVPVRRRQDGVFHALDGVEPSAVQVVILGGEPHPDPQKATGRAFEQGDLTAWPDDLAQPGHITPSLLSFVCAAVALLPNANKLGLDPAHLDHQRGGKLRRALQGGRGVLPPPKLLFESQTGQGVLWLNRTPTATAVRDACGAWRATEGHRKLHRAFWRPVTDAILSLLAREAVSRPIVFALFGARAKSLRGRIEACGARLCAPLGNLRFVEGGHPARARDFFRFGNPLGRINALLADPIDWCSPAAARGAAPLQRPHGGAVTPAGRASARSAAIMAHTVGKYRAALRSLADR